MTEDKTKSEIASRTSISFRERKNFDLVTADFGESVNGQIEEWLHESIRVYEESLQVLFLQKVPEWRRICEGKPRDKEKSFPWPKASNLVVQVVGQRVDDISARVMGLVWSTSPVAIYRYFFKSDDPDRAEKKRVILEQFMDNVAYDPDELDLYRKENIWFSDSAKLGTAFLKIYPDKRTQMDHVGYDEKTKSTILEQSETYNGPSVDNLKFEHVLCDPTASTWEKSRLKVHKRTLNRHELEERAFSGFYDKESVEKIKGKPDRHGPDVNRQRSQTKKGINASQSSILAEWDVYECWFWWYINARSKDSNKIEKVRVDLTFSYHYSTRTMLRQVYNFMPNNAVPIIPTKLSISEEGPYGRGYADMLENSQDEVSTQHNQRIDARTMSLTGILRSSNPQIDKNIEVYPFCIIPGTEDEISMLKNGVDIGDGGIADEELALRLADERAGVGPATAGMGSGSVNKKGQYGSMGTLAVMQDSNSRVNHRLSDFRHSHVKLMSVGTAMYGKFGTGSKGSYFGLDDELLKEALQDYLEKKIRIPIRSATASANKEVEKQNDMLLRNALSQHNVEKIKLIQAIRQSGGQPEDIEAMIDMMNSQDVMMKRTLRNFGFDNPDEYVSKWKGGQKNVAQNQRGPAAAVDPRNVGMAPPVPAQGDGATPGGPGGMGANGSGLAEPAGGTR